MLVTLVNSLYSLELPNSISGVILRHSPNISKLHILTRPFALFSLSLTGDKYSVGLSHWKE